MFRQGKPRAFIHNLRLASMLSFVAGIVNICGVMSIGVLTTNVTGHFAFFSENFINENYQSAIHFLGFITAFFMGAALSGFLIELFLRYKPRISHTVPMTIEILILICAVAATRQNLLLPEWIACLLLFAMGMQNAMVTKISQATVRTTHLTGLFTDLGIEVSQLYFYRDKANSRKLSASIFLRLTIILFFFFGGIFGGFLYRKFDINALIAAALALLIALLYDNIRVGFIYYFRKIRERHGDANQNLNGEHET